MGGTRWTRKTLRKLVKELRRKKFKVGRETVRRLLKKLDYSLRHNRKERSKRQDPDRDRQMRYLARQRRAFLKAKKPVISVDCKKKELIGNFKNPGRTWRREARSVLATDFPSDADGKVIPMGSMRWLAIAASSVWGSRMRRPHLPSTSFGAGG
jgi:hypothetical protein